MGRDEADRRRRKRINEIPDLEELIARCIQTY